MGMPSSLWRLREETEEEQMWGSAFTTGDTEEGQTPACPAWMAPEGRAAQDEEPSPQGGCSWSREDWLLSHMGVHG